MNYKRIRNVGAASRAASVGEFLRNSPSRFAERRPWLGRPTRRGGALVALLAVVFVLGLIFVGLMLLPARRGAREAARRNVCLNNLKQIAFALQNYADAHGGKFPPAYTTDADGKPLHSWRTLILPYLEAEAVYDLVDLTKPWDDPANEKARNVYLPCYQCPSAALDDPDARTTYLAVVTPNSCFRAAEPRSRSDITDGAANTLLVIDADAEHAVHWMSPQDADENVVLELGNGQPRTSHPGVFLGLFADGHSEAISTDTSAAQRLALISITGNDNADIGK